MAEREKLIEVKDLQISFGKGRKKFVAVDHVNFDIYKGETFSLVGESGSGKTTIGRAITRINPTSAGEIYFKGKKINGKISKELDREVIKSCQMIFQDPYASLNPRMTVRELIQAPLDVYSHESEAEKLAKVKNIMAKVGLREEYMSKYPHEFSGGMRQRVMIAMGLICHPQLLIADEPTTALDVTIQAQILDLLRNLKNKINSSIMLITHDLGVIAEMADYVVVMYAGRVVEKGTVQEIFANPSHPYTIGLMASKPVIGKKVDKLYSIPGKVPNPVNMPDYCYFRDRCEMRCPECDGKYPCEISLSETHKVSCYRYYDKKEGK